TAQQMGQAVPDQTGLAAEPVAVDRKGDNRLIESGQGRPQLGIAGVVQEAVAQQFRLCLPDGAKAVPETGNALQVLQATHASRHVGTEQRSERKGWELPHGRIGSGSGELAAAIVTPRSLPISCSDYHQPRSAATRLAFGPLIHLSCQHETSLPFR